MNHSFEQMLESKQALEQINRPRESGEPLLPAKRERYEDRNRRITLYLSCETYASLQAVRSQGYSQSRLADRAIKEYIVKNWPTTEP